MKHIKSYESTEKDKIYSKIDPSKVLLKHLECNYTDDYIEEDLTKHWYAVEPDKYSYDKISCPLCKIEEFFITHGKSLTCPRCKLQMKNYGNSLKCRISRDNLDNYNDIMNNINKYNL